MTQPNKQEGRPSPIILSEVLERIGGSEGFLEELLNLYVEEFRKTFSQIQEAVKNSHFKRLEELGHYLKGASSNLSLVFLQSACLELEQAARTRDMKRIQAGAATLEREFQRLQSFRKRGWKSAVARIPVLSA
jgi:HPt (histidine-containing phosphotransfer) domain-containing protein